MRIFFPAATLTLVLLAAASGKSAIAACTAGPTTLCLNEQRFKIEVQWKDFQNNTGVGQAVSLTADTGYFWFFNSANVELVVKVLDGRALNNKFWVFFGALSNVEYTMTVTDSVTGSVKTYFNPSGQFASVGDTNAFSTTGTVNSAYHVVEPGARSTLPSSFAFHSSTRVNAMATCAPTETSLCLNGGRFRVEVNWKDFQGNTGVGTAVSLTADTGYFWFFNSANVELVVKVLDARGLNSRFWVFYGALSNVEYEMTVTDTVTGNVNTYGNPSGRFASVGDTDAFRAGHSVTAQLDPSRAVSADIPTTCGSLTATAGDGTVFTLTVPKDALLSDTRITMTPLASIDGLPLSGGLSAAVDLAPTGLRLFQLATLTITPPAPIPLAEEITFAWRGSGEEFFLYPPELDRSKISMKLIHFSGYGVGRGSAADEAAQRERVPASPEDAFSQRLQALFAGRRRMQSIGPVVPAQTDAEFSANVEAQFLDFYNRFIKPNLEVMRRHCDRGRLIQELAMGWERQRQLLGLQCCNAESQNLADAQLDYLVNCYNEAFDKCVNKNDPAQVSVMMGILRQLQLLGAASRVDESKIERCVRFELDFESSIRSEPALWAWQYRAKVPIRVSLPNNFGTGSAPADLKFDYVGPSIPPPCSITISSGSGIFEVVKLTIDFNVYEGGAPPPEPVIMVFDPGRPRASQTLTCPQAPPSTIEFDFIDLWNAFGHIDNTFPFTARGWQRVGGAVYARKTYQHPAQPYPGTTLMDLKHTPQK